MIDNNKRLVIFNDHGEHTYGYDQWKETIENQYSTIDIKGASKERKESLREVQPKYLFTLNYFPEVDLPIGLEYTMLNSIQLRALLANVLKNGLNGQFKGRYPNFIALNFVEKEAGGDPLKLINEINEKSKKTKNRETTMFKVLTRPPSPLITALQSKNLKDVNFAGSNLANKNVSGLDFKVIKNKSLEKANLTGADLRNADLQGVNLNLATFDKTTKLDGANLEGAGLTNVNLKNVNLQGIKNKSLKNANLSYSDLGNGCDLTGIDLTGAKVMGTWFRKAKGLSKQQIEDLKNRGAKF